MDSGGFSWSIMTIVGPILLGVVLLWAFLRNRRDPDTRDTTERGTHDVYDAEERSRREEDGDG